MSQSKISICYYPTTTILVDDSKEFLETTLTELLVENVACRFYDSPQEALNFLNNIYKPTPFINRCVAEKATNSADHLTVELDIRKIHEEIYNSERFNEVTKVVVDYSMPLIDGLQFCRSIKNSHIHKILLTGEAGKELAVDAFNVGLIDKFIMKSSKDYLNLLLASIKELEKKYFLDLSKIVFRKSTNAAREILLCLSDSIFVRFFNQLCSKYHITEYYLLDWCGSFLLLDIKANPSWLIVKSEKEINNLCTFAQDVDAPLDVIDALKSRKMVPYFHTEQDLQTPPAGWSKYMHPATELKGEDQTYYYSFVADTNLYKLDKNKIISYQNYLETL